MYSAWFKKNTWLIKISTTIYWWFQLNEILHLRTQPLQHGTAQMCVELIWAYKIEIHDFFNILNHYFNLENNLGASERFLIFNEVFKKTKWIAKSCSNFFLYLRFCKIHPAIKINSFNYRRVHTSYFKVNQYAPCPVFIGWYPCLPLGHIHRNGNSRSLLTNHPFFLRQKWVVLCTNDTQIKRKCLSYISPLCPSSRRRWHCRRRWRRGRRLQPDRWCHPGVGYLDTIIHARNNNDLVTEKFVLISHRGRCVLTQGYILVELWPRTRLQNVTTFGSFHWYY